MPKPPAEKSSFFHLLFSLLLISIIAFQAGCGKSDESVKSPDAASSTSNQETASKTAPATSQKELGARGVLETMAKAYRTAKTYSDAGTVRIQISAGDQKMDQKMSFSTAFERPNKLRLEVYLAKVVVDGKKLYASMDDLPGQVLEKAVTADLTMKTMFSDTILAGALSGGVAGPSPQSLLLLEDNAIDYLLRDAEEPKLAEPGKIDGRDYYRVQIRKVDGLAVLWIDKETFVLRRMILPTDDLRRQITEGGGTPVDTISLVADFTDARFSGSINAEAFQFQTPPGAEIVRFFIPPNPAQLLGKKTPDFQFTDLSGKPITPQSLAGKIVILDFWATWCAPCKASMPNLQKVYEKYKDNDKVAFLAVSIDTPQIENKVIEDLLKELKISIPACRDENRNSVAFKFEGIPSTFIIDASGIVQDYEAGVNAELENVLSSKIEKVLKGENIFDEPLKRYREELEKHEKFITANQKEAGGETVQEQSVPRAKIAEPTQPRTLKLSKLWKCDALKSPGNILVLSLPNSAPRLLAIDSFNTIAEVGLDGKLIAAHKLNIGDAEIVSNLRAFTAKDGKLYIAAFASAQQRCHILDDKWNLILSYPEDAVKNPHSGIADVQLGDIDGDGSPEMLVGYWGVVGVQAVSLEGKRIWSNRSISNVVHLALSEPGADGRRNLLCDNNNGTIVVLDDKGQRREEISVRNRMLYWIIGGDLRHDGQPLWCGLAAPKMGESVALGFNLKGDELWSYDLPVGVQPQPVEPIVVGQITRDGPSQWIMPGPDGSIHIISADGKPIDSFNYGSVLQGIAVVSINGQPTILVSSPNGLEAWKIE